MQVPETVAVIMQDAFERDPLVVHGAVLPPAMLLLSTLSAFQVCLTFPSPFVYSYKTDRFSW